MKQTFYYLLVGLFTLFCENASASHGVGADIKFTSIGGNTYQFELTMIRDCAGITPSLPTLDVSGCGNVGTISMVQVGVQTALPGLCPSVPTTCSTPPGVVAGAQSYVYRGTYTFPNACADWKISFGQCCRNAAISNLQQPSAANIYTETHLNNLATTTNSSPNYISLPVFYLCAGQPFAANLGGNDPDGDEVVYALAQPLNDATTPIAYIGSFTTTQPMCSVAPSTASFNTATGVFSITPCNNQQAVISVIASEYRVINGVRTLIATTRRDMQLFVTNCGTNTPPVIAEPTAVSPTNSYNAGAFSVCPGTTMSFHLVVNDADAANIITATAPLLPTGATLTQTGTNPLTLVFTWTPTAAQIGNHTLAIRASDDFCPIAGFAVKNWVIQVVGARLTTSNTPICGGTPTTISLYPNAPAIPNAQYTWSASPITPVQAQNGSFTASVARTTTFTLQYTANGCTSTSTATVQAYGGVVATPSTVNFNPANSASPIQVIATYPNPSPVIPDTSGLNGNHTCNSTPASHIIGTDTTRTVATGGMGTPFTGFWHDGRFQMLLTASELQAAGVQRGIISQLAFDIKQKNSTIPYNGFTIKIVKTNLTNFQIGGFIPMGVVVYSSPAYTTALGVNNFAFQTPYFWDGIDNLIIELCYDNSSYTNYDHLTYTATNANTVLYQRVDASSGCSLSTPTLTNNRPNITLTSCTTPAQQAVVTYHWTSQTGTISNPLIANPLVTPTGTINTIDRFIVTATDGVCTSSDTVLVQNIGTQICNVSADIQITGGFSCTSHSASLDARTLSTGSGALSFVWNTGAVTPTIVVTNPGTYTVTVTSAGSPSCSSTRSVTLVAAPSNVTAAVTSSANRITCSTTSINLTAAPTTGNYSYIWSTGATQAITAVTTAGNYTVTVTDNATGCTASSRKAITQNTTPPVFVLNSSSPSLDCRVATVNLDACAPTTQNYSYRWSGSPSTICTRPPVTAAGCYTVTVTNNINGCTTSQSTCVTANFAVADTSTFGIRAAGIQGAGCGQAALTVVNLPTIYAYHWSTGGTTDSIHVNHVGTYTVTVTNTVSGCTATKKYTLGLFTGIATETAMSSCSTPTGTAHASWNGGFPPFLVSVDNGLASTTSNSFFDFQGLAAGIHIVKVRDVSGCVLNLTFTTQCSVSTLQEGSAVYSILLAPNPATNEVSLTPNLANTPTATLVLRNIIGQALFTQTVKNLQTTLIPISDLPQGIYTTEIWVKDELVAVKKLIKL